MTAKLDIVGHFGTTYSYATVASRIARAMHAVGRLGSVSNLDPDWHDSHLDLRVKQEAVASHVLVVAVPHHYLDAYPALYGKERSLLFVSPNTDALSPEHAETCRKFGALVAPSLWCAEVVDRAVAVPGAEAWVLPLGVDETLLATRDARLSRLDARVRTQSAARCLHFSTDHHWPGRKGTEELLEAWKVWDGRYSVDDDLVLHVPQAIFPETVRRVRSMDLDPYVRVETGDARGNEDQVRRLLGEADLVIAPSRCEGFGMVLLSALAAGVPLLCTYNTGHRDFLSEMPGWLSVASGAPEALAGEVGMAPTVPVRPLAGSIGAALHKDVRQDLLTELMAYDPIPWSWPVRMEAYTARLLEWMDGGEL